MSALDFSQINLYFTVQLYISYLQMEKSQLKCAYCHEYDHALLDYHKRTCMKCHKKRPSHYLDDCSMQPRPPLNTSHSPSSNLITTATVIETCNPGNFATRVSLDELDALLKQVLSSSNIVMSMTSGNS